MASCQNRVIKFFPRKVTKLLNIKHAAQLPSMFPKRLVGGFIHKDSLTLYRQLLSLSSARTGSMMGTTWLTYQLWKKIVWTKSSINDHLIHLALNFLDNRWEALSFLRWISSFRNIVLNSFFLFCEISISVRNFHWNFDMWIRWLILISAVTFKLVINLK